jgi:hypothetical protein
MARCLLPVKVTPNAKRDEIGEWKAEELRVKVAAPPLDGRANEAVRDLLADGLDLPKGAVRLSRGASSRHKTFQIDGLDLAGVQKRLRVTA